MPHIASDDISIVITIAAQRWNRPHLDLGRPLDGLLERAHGCELRLGLVLEILRARRPTRQSSGRWIRKLGDSDRTEFSRTGSRAELARVCFVWWEDDGGCWALAGEALGVEVMAIPRARLHVGGGSCGMAVAGRGAQVTR